MISNFLLFSLLNSCLAVTITSTTDTYQTAYPEVSEGVVQYISPIGCVVTYYDAGTPSSTTLIDCPTDITNIPEGCQLSGCCKTVCPTGDFCSWVTTGSAPGESTKRCDTINCFPWDASAAELRYICSSNSSDPSYCYETISTDGTLTTVTTTDCGGDDDGGSVPSGCGTLTSVISSTTHTWTTCTGSVSPPPGCEFSTTRELTSLLVCSSECTKTFSTDDRTTTVTFSSCPSGEITAPPGFYPEQPDGCSAYSDRKSVV